MTTTSRKRFRKNKYTESRLREQLRKSCPQYRIEGEVFGVLGYIISFVYQREQVEVGFIILPTLVFHVMCFGYYVCRNYRIDFHCSTQTIKKNS